MRDLEDLSSKFAWYVWARSAGTDVTQDVVISKLESLPTKAR